MRPLGIYIEEYGPTAGPMIHRLEWSRAAYKGVSTRRRRRIEAITGRPYRVRRPRPPLDGPLPLFPDERAPSVVGGPPG